MKKMKAGEKVDVYGLLEKIRKEKPLVHHLTNWVTIADCANVVKALGASPVMAHDREEVSEMARMASALVLNIGTLTGDLVEAMKIAARSANRKGIPVILDPCGAGATSLRNAKCLELLDQTRIDILKGNCSEMARLDGQDVRTKGVESSPVRQDMVRVARRLAKKRRCVAVVTGREDLVAGGHKVYVVRNGHPMMADVVGTGCMAASVIGTFAAVERDWALASAAGLACYGIAAECAAKKSRGPASFKDALIDCLYRLDRRTIAKYGWILSLRD